MARVLVPVMPRRYNHNPVGSSTAVVTMRGSNPFESGVAGLKRVSSYPGQLAGLGAAGLGDAPIMGPPNPNATDSGTTPINWAGMVQSVATAAQPLISAQATRLLSPQVNTIAGQYLPQPLPVNPQLMQPKSSKMPYVLVGAGVLGLGLVFLLMRRKKR